MLCKYMGSMKELRRAPWSPRMFHLEKKFRREKIIHGWRNGHERAALGKPARLMCGVEYEGWNLPVLVLGGMRHTALVDYDMLLGPVAPKQWFYITVMPLTQGTYFCFLLLQALASCGSLFFIHAFWFDWRSFGMSLAELNFLLHLYFLHSQG